MTKIAFIGTYIPQRCGIATYTHHLRQSIRGARGWRGIDPVIALRTSEASGLETAPGIWELDKHDRTAYIRAADRLNRSEVAVVSLQHEFGIFGGEAGEYVLDLAERLEKPLAVTFHTVFEKPEEPYRSVQERLAKRADMILVMNRRAVDFLHGAFRIPRERIQVVPHGTPEPAPGKRISYRRKMGWDGRKVVMTFGLLGRGKGLETVIHALDKVAREVPDVLYAIVGQTHPEVKKQEGEAYREELQAMIQQRGLERHVTMIDRYVEEDELVGLLSACDLYVTPYPGLQQITSGTLAYAVGLGRPVLSTPYVYAEELLGSYPELLLAPGDAELWAERMCKLLGSEEERLEMERGMMDIGRAMHWPKVGKLHLSLFGQLSAKAKAGAAASSLKQDRPELAPKVVEA
ncbi:glycosyltransferase family 4 protein [Paenibacillus ihumii]|uniref:glycosyltransferase family 4 protein n=1 Tax=Paenibacillus ihumii TaxID=687436 RepID=UPI0006D81EF4|nr:glycosyltransferase family 4 protein [Paenibacillus ihumii]